MENKKENIQTLDTPARTNRSKRKCTPEEMDEWYRNIMASHGFTVGPSKDSASKDDSRLDVPVIEEAETKVAEIDDVKKDGSSVGGSAKDPKLITGITFNQFVRRLQTMRAMIEYEELMSRFN